MFYGDDTNAHGNSIDRNNKKNYLNSRVRRKKNGLKRRNKKHVKIKSTNRLPLLNSNKSIELRISFEKWPSYQIQLKN